MSMLTPPGMGGKYRITGNRYPRMRRPHNRHRIVLASLASVVALSVGAWGTLQLIDVFTGGGTPASAAGSTQGKGSACAAGAKTGKAGRKAVDLPKPDSFEVNVLNATERGGLAKKTADELKERGFKIGEVANAPKEFDKKVDNAGVLLGATGEETGPKLKLLGAQLEGTESRFDEREGEDVDLVLGKAFDELSKKKQAEAAVEKLEHPKPSPAAGRCAEN
jgi:hypothetical protein